MNEKLNLPMALVLLDLEDDTGTPLADAEVFAVLLAAAMIGELELEGRIRHVPGGRITLRGGKPNPLLEPAEHCLGARPTPFGEAFEAVADKDLRHTVHSHLVGIGALKVHTGRSWLFWKKHSWVTADPTIEQDLRRHLQDYVLHPEGALKREDVLLSLLVHGKLLHTVWPQEAPLDVIEARAQLTPIHAALGEWLARTEHAVTLQTS